MNYDVPLAISLIVVAVALGVIVFLRDPNRPRRSKPRR